MNADAADGAIIRAMRRWGSVRIVVDGTVRRMAALLTDRRLLGLESTSPAPLPCSDPAPPRDEARTWGFVHDDER